MTRFDYFVAACCFGVAFLSIGWVALLEVWAARARRRRVRS